MIPALTLLIGVYVVFRVVEAVEAAPPTPIVQVAAFVTILTAIGVVLFTFYLANQAGNAMEEQMRQLQNLGF